MKALKVISDAAKVVAWFGVIVGLLAFLIFVVCYWIVGVEYTVAS